MVLPSNSSINPRPYPSNPLPENFGDVEPMDRFKEWLKHANDNGVVEPDAFVLSTFDGKVPQARTIALRGIAKDSFLIYTNYHSKKAREMDAFPQVSMTFYFKETYRQIRIQGNARKVSEEQSDKYFASRPRGSQIGAWVSRQSEKLNSRKELMEVYGQFEKDLEENISRPPFWGGFEIVASEYEFMQAQENRLHDRFRFSKNELGKFKCERLWP